MENGPIEYKPSAFYFRQTLRAAATKKEAIDIGLTVVSELENLKAWVREQGYIPPKRHLMRREISEKGWAVSQTEYR